MGRVWESNWWNLERKREGNHWTDWKAHYEKDGRYCRNQILKRSRFETGRIWWSMNINHKWIQHKAEDKWRVDLKGKVERNVWYNKEIWNEKVILK